MVAPSSPEFYPNGINLKLSFSGIFNGLDVTVKTSMMEKGCLLTASNAKKYLVNIMVHQVSKVDNNVLRIGFKGVEGIV